MRLGLFNGGRLGVVEGELVRDVSAIVGPAGPEGRLARLIDVGLVALSPAVVAAAPVVEVKDVRWEAPMPRPGKIIGAPANYYEHIDEMVASKSILEWGVFLKASTSVIGPGETIELPYSDQRTDHEGELAVIIGRGGRNIPLESALSHVFGYTGVLDITVRSSEDRSTRKSFDTFTPMGTTVVTADEVADPGLLDLTLRVNGEVRQHSSTGKMIYGVPELIAYASSIMRLEPGDVIATGTPAGVGPIHDGDVIDLEIPGVSDLRVNVSAANAVAYAQRPGPHTAVVRG